MCTLQRRQKKGEKILQGDRIETPTFIRKNNLDIDYQFYITNQISKPVSQVFALIIEQLPNYRLQKKTIQLHNQLRKATRDIEKTLIHKRIRAANEKYAAELLFSDALRQIKNTRKGQKEITHFMNVVVPSG
jgi:ABC-type phosphate transport system auxiliary subunit